ncbi:MAG: hypothetical protein H7Z74_00265, partial [Anaerolineae bacterium]|nr:hypothetical protein [Gemmatimonadaceae bacterium]
MLLRWRIPGEIWPGLIAGLLSGLVGALFFAAAHAVLILPIWSRMGSGLVFGALAGIAAGWALAENYPAHAGLSSRDTLWLGARFGSVLWLLVSPVTAADAVLRATGIAPRLELVAVGVALVLSLGAGAFFGWRKTRRRRGMISGAVATLALTIAMAGPVPVARSLRAFGIFLAVLPAA